MIDVYGAKRECPITNGNIWKPITVVESIKRQISPLIRENIITHITPIGFKNEYIYDT